MSHAFSKNRNNLRLDQSEMLSSMGSSVDNDQLNDTMFSLGAVDYTDSARAAAPSSNAHGAFFSDSSDSAMSVMAHSFAKMILSGEKKSNDNQELEAQSIPSLAKDDDFSAQDNFVLVNEEPQEELMSASFTLIDNDEGMADKHSSADAMSLVNEDETNDEAVAYDEAQGDDPQDDERFLVYSPALKEIDDGSKMVIEELKSCDITPPKTVYLDAAQELRAAKTQERVAAQVNDMLSFNKDKQNAARFSLVEQELNLIKVNRKKDDLLADEDEELGRIELEDFITGNVTTINQTLMTGTDNHAVAMGLGASEGASEGDEEQIEDVGYKYSSPTYSSTLSVRDYNTNKGDKLLPMLIHDFGVNWLTYGLAFVVCVLCLMKVYQVQETRDLTARVNEVIVANGDLDKQWLNLVAEKQNLSEHAKIRAYAADQLSMVSPKTNSEEVISLHDIYK